jgi:predicted nucleic acid-binding Zn ribbon protein
MDPLHSILPSVLSDLLKKGPISPAKLELAWQAAVGGALARVTQVRLEGSSVLVVAVADERWQRELKRSTKMILGRLRALLGDSAVTRLEVVGPSSGRTITAGKIWTPSSS